MTISSSEWTAERAFVEHEHRELVPGLNRIHDVACSVGSGFAAGSAPDPPPPVLMGAHFSHRGQSERSVVGTPIGGS